MGTGQRGSFVQGDLGRWVAARRMAGRQAVSAAIATIDMEAVFLRARLVSHMTIRRVVHMPRVGRGKGR